MDCKILKLKEYEQSSKLELNPCQVNLLIKKFNKQLSVNCSLDGTGYVVGANSNIGIYNLNDLKVFVEPKVNISNVFKMLCYSYDLIYWYNDYSTFETIKEMFEYMLLLFQRQVDRLIKKGLFANYVMENDELRYVKGRINIEELVKKDWEKSTINCQYDSFKIDVLENQIIRYTMEKLLQLPIENKKIKRALANTNRYLTSVSKKPITAKDIDSFRYTALNKHYKATHRFCKMVLEMIGVSDKQGVTSFNQFFLDMNLLFEKYVGEILKEIYPGEYHVSRERSMFLDEFENIIIIPDVVIYKDRKPYIVIDTKYKASKSVKNADIYQMVTYMNKTKTNGLLIYPAHEMEDKEYNINGKKLYIKTIDLSNIDSGAKELEEFLYSINIGPELIF